VTTAVVDTNVLVSALTPSRSDSPPAKVFEMWLAQKFELFTSVPINEEVARALESRYFVSRVPAEKRERLLVTLKELAMPVLLLKSVRGSATHPEDDLVLATALNANADYLVTGDKALLDLGTFDSTRIVTAAEFVAILEAS
jgi:uncharacterized protein